MAQMDSNTLAQAFSGLQAAPTAQAAPMNPVVTVDNSQAVDKKKEDEKARLAAEEQMIKDNFRTVINTDASLAQELHSLSSAIEVVNTLGFGAGGDRILDVEASNKKAADLIAKGYIKSLKDWKKGMTAPDGTKIESPRVLAEVPRIVGYVIQNNSQVSINYKTTQCTPNEDGTYAVAEVDAVLAPGAQAMLDKKHLIMLSAIPQIAFVFSNGKMKKAPGQFLADTTAETLGDKFYFTFDKESGLAVHSANVKKVISVAGDDGVHHVLPEYAPVFGYLENQKDPIKKTRAKGEKAAYSTSDAQATYINQLLNGTNTF